MSHAGLPITSDLETLDIDTPQGSSLADKKKNITRLHVFLESSRGGYIGINSTDDKTKGLTELKVRETEKYDDPVALISGTKDMNVEGEWNTSGKIFIRQVDPLPLSVLAVVPSGKIGGM